MYAELPQASLTMMPEEAIKRTDDMLETTFNIRRKNLCTLIVNLSLFLLKISNLSFLGCPSDLEFDFVAFGVGSSEYIEFACAFRKLDIVHTRKKGKCEFTKIC